MTKRKTKATGLAITSGQDGKPSAALSVGYANLLADLKARVRAAQLRAVVSVNRELILLYWDIGRIIVEAQTTKGYGKQVVERPAGDLQKGISRRGGFLATKRLVHAQLLSGLVGDAAKTLTSCERIGHVRSASTHFRIAVGT